MMPRPQFRLRSLFILTAIVAVGCAVWPPLRARFWPYIVDKSGWAGNSFGMQRVIISSDGTQTVEHIRENLYEQAAKQKRERSAKSLLGKKLVRWPAPPAADQADAPATFLAPPSTD